MLIKLVLNIIPIAQARVRVNRAGIAYKTSRQKAAERELDLALHKDKPQNTLEGPLEVSFVAYLPIPMSLSKKQKEGMILGHIRHIHKPDLDNLCKQLLDALTRNGFWADDRQVVKLNMEKRYGVNPRWEIIIESVTQDNACQIPVSISAA